MKHSNNPTPLFSSFLSSSYLAPHLKAFAQDLAQQGFTPLTISGYLSSILHFDTWLQIKKLPLEKIGSQVVDDFANHRCNCPHRSRTRAISRKYIKRIQRFVDYLSLSKVILSVPDRPPIHQHPLLVAFAEHLNQRGLAAPTVAKYERSIRILLPSIGDDPSVYDSAIIRQAICDEAHQRGQGETKNMTTALRAYLRFLATQGACKPDLDYAVPTVAQWRLSSLPRYISEEKVERVIASCSDQTHQGVRDRAILLLLARLGLRAGDIVNMQLDDIDWPGATLRVKGKSQRQEKLPLPQDVGDAVLVYLKNARPRVPSNYLFLCFNAPHRPFATSSGISGIVRAALARAGIENPPSFGAHLLRHSAATTLLRSGASLESVSTLLRHRSPDMTAVYAKVDIKMLAEIAQPWPEVVSC